MASNEFMKLFIHNYYRKDKTITPDCILAEGLVLVRAPFTGAPAFGTRRTIVSWIVLVLKESCAVLRLLLGLVPWPWHGSSLQTPGNPWMCRAVSEEGMLGLWALAGASSFACMGTSSQDLHDQLLSKFHCWNMVRPSALTGAGTMPMASELLVESIKFQVL